MSTWLNAPIEMQFRIIDGSSIRFAESEDRDHHATRRYHWPTLSFLHERLPYCKLDIIDAGHFTWEDAADEYVALVTNWWSGGYRTT